MSLRRIHEHKQWSTVEQLYKTGCAEVPYQCGVYCVVVPDCFKVKFLNTTTAISEYRGRSLLYPADQLEIKFQWSDKKILYIGKASGLKSKLHQRILQLVRYAYGEVRNHRGGRALWQIENAHQLLVGDAPCPQAARAEACLLHEYVRTHNTLPLANWILPQLLRDNGDGSCCP